MGKAGKGYVPLRPQPVPPVLIIENGCDEQFFAQTPFLWQNTYSERTKSVIGFGNLFQNIIYHTKKSLIQISKMKVLLRTKKNMPMHSMVCTYEQKKYCCFLRSCKVSIFNLNLNFNYIVKKQNKENFVKKFVDSGFVKTC